MEVLDKKYRFECPNCNATIRAKREELQIGKLMICFKCPSCNTKQKVWNTSVTTETTLN